MSEARGTGSGSSGSDPAARVPRVVPPVYLLGSLVVMGLLHRWAPIRRLLAPPVSYLGGIPAAFGLLLVVTAARQFVVAETGLRPGSESTVLVQDGWFRITRNPMYLGMTLLLLGVALLLGTLGPLLVPPVFMALMQTLFIAKEERWMEERFGDAYLAYRRRTRRWL